MILNCVHAAHKIVVVVIVILLPGIMTGPPSCLETFYCFGLITLILNILR